MEDYRLLVDLHRGNDRQGPGSEDETLLAMRLAGLDGARPLRIADIGCGTGASTLLLARELDAHIVAVDCFPEFLAVLLARAEAQGLARRITPLACSMDSLSFAPASLDVIWSEGAVYNMGFAAGISQWRRFLKPGGLLAVSEITWLTAERPQALQAHWSGEYPEIDTAAAKLGILERHGYAPVGYFVLPRHCWTEHYYQPLRRSFPEFLRRNAGSEAARRIIAAEEREIALYEQYHASFGYGFYIARKVGE